MRLNPYRWAGGAQPTLGTPTQLLSAAGSGPIDFAVHTAVTGNLLVRFLWRDFGAGATRPMIVEWGDPALLPGIPMQQVVPIIDSAFNEGVGRIGIFVGYLRDAKLGAQTLRLSAQDTLFGRIGGAIQDIGAGWSGSIGDAVFTPTNGTVATLTSDQLVPTQRDSVVVGIGGGNSSALGPFTIAGLGAAWTSDAAAIAAGTSPGTTTQLVSKVVVEPSDPMTLQLTSATTVQYWSIGLVEICP